MLKVGEVQQKAGSAGQFRRLFARVHGWHWHTTFLIMLLAALQGAIYLLAIPPWFHYDEPTHFEYAWLIAHQPSLPGPGDENIFLRREIVASMREQHIYDWLLLAPSPLLSDNPMRFDLGFSELHHFPLYYLIVSLPLRIFSHLDIVTQLHIARFVSLCMFLFTIRAAAGIMAELTSEGHVLRIAVPFTLALLPPFVDAMTAVNNDVGAVLFFSLFLWSAIRTIRAGLTWRRVALVISTAVLAAAMKSTALVALGLIPAVVIIALWTQRGWAWRWPIGAVLAISGAVLFASVQWENPAAWYRAPSTFENQPIKTARVLHSAAPVGSYILALNIPPDTKPDPLFGPIVDFTAGLGQPITVGAWLWADRPAAIESPGLRLSSTSLGGLQTISKPVEVTTTPLFISWSITLANDINVMSFILPAKSLSADSTDLQLYIDGVVVTPGRFPADQPPQFQDGSAAAGVWGGQPFTNWVRNASFEQTGPGLQPSIDRVLLPYTSRRTSTIFFELIDVDRSSQIAGVVVQRQIASFFYSFSWVRLKPAGTFWYAIMRNIVIVAVVGCLIWFIGGWRRGRDRYHRAATLFLLLAAIPVWLSSMMRVFPTFVGTLYIPIARYGFPAIIPVVLGITGGWYTLVPKRFHLALMVGLIVGMTVLSCMSIVATWQLPGGRLSDVVTR